MSILMRGSSSSSSSSSFTSSSVPDSRIFNLVSTISIYADLPLPKNNNTSTTTLSSSSSSPSSSCLELKHPTSISIDSKDNLIIANSFAHSICKVAQDGKISMLAGVYDKKGYVDGPADQALFDVPCGVYVNSKDEVYIADTNNHVIRKLSKGRISTILGQAMKSGYREGVALTEALLNGPEAVTVNPSNENQLFISDTRNFVIRMLDLQTNQTSLICGIPTTFGYSNGPALESKFHNLSNIAFKSNNILVMADAENNSIRELDLNSKFVTTISGCYSGFGGFRDTAPQYMKLGRPISNEHANDPKYDHISLICHPLGIFVDRGAKSSPSSSTSSSLSSSSTTTNDIIYLADTQNQTIRCINELGQVFTLAGEPGLDGFTDGRGDLAKFCWPSALVVNSRRELIVLDTNNNQLRKIIRSTSIFPKVSTPAAPSSSLSSHLMFPSNSSSSSSNSSSSSLLSSSLSSSSSDPYSLSNVYLPSVAAAAAAVEAAALADERTKKERKRKSTNNINENNHYNNNNDIGTTSNSSSSSSTSSSNTSSPNTSLTTTSVLTWSVDDVCEWLSSFGEIYSQSYVPLFRSNGIDGAGLLNDIDQDEQTLIEIGITSVLHRKKIMREIHTIKTKIK